MTIQNKKSNSEKNALLDLVQTVESPAVNHCNQHEQSVDENSISLVRKMKVSAVTGALALGLSAAAIWIPDTNEPVQEGITYAAQTLKGRIADTLSTE